MNGTVTCTRDTSPYNSCDLATAGSCGKETICDDNIDNDCDGKIDSEDDDCKCKTNKDCKDIFCSECVGTNLLGLFGFKTGTCEQLKSLACKAEPCDAFANGDAGVDCNYYADNNKIKSCLSTCMWLWEPYDIWQCKSSTKSDSEWGCSANEKPCLASDCTNMKSCGSSTYSLQTGIWEVTPGTCTFDCCKSGETCYDGVCKAGCTKDSDCIDSRSYDDPFYYVTSKPKCHIELGKTTGECVECLQATDCKDTDGTWNIYCPKETVLLPTHEPNSILPTCTDNICQCEASCAGNVECALGFCCTGETPQGPNVILLGKTDYTCEPKSTVANPWLCT